MTRFGAPLTERQFQILMGVVQEHVRTKEPVGSQVVREKYGVDASTATIRHEMVELERAGYLQQPHTSAGRLPLDSAYRLYVNSLMRHGLPEPQPPTSRWIQGEYRRLGSEPHELLRVTSRLLARVTSHPAVVTSPPAQEPTITSFRLQPVSTNTALLVYETSVGEERHHLLRLEEPTTAAQMATLSQVLQSLLSGKRVSALVHLPTPDVVAGMRGEPVSGSLLGAIRAAAAGDDESVVYVDGTSYILDEPEFEERERLRSFMRTLDEDSALRQVLRGATENCEITVTIGQEHRLPNLVGCSLVATSYPYGRARGVVGIFGPTRMDYLCVMASVAFVARKLGETLAEIVTEH